MLKLRFGKPEKIFIAVCSLLLLAGAAYSGLWLHESQPVTQRELTYVRISVAPGMNAERIAAELFDHRLISSVNKFRIKAKLHGLDGKLKAGEYMLDTHMDDETIIKILVEGRSEMPRITVPEGYTVKQIGELLQAKHVKDADKFEQMVQQFRPFDYMAAEDGGQYTAEGFLFPDTYEIGVNTTAQDVLAVMTGEFDRRFSADMRKRAAEMGLTIREVVILASMVEREAQDDSERPVIAQVFMNRLAQYMPLQSCATIQYILGHPKAELTVADTEIVSPYNTYQNPGLPPGPIANPGLASLKAVLYSTPNDYLYFVARGDGTHHFSRTYEEHLQAIDRNS